MDNSSKPPNEKSFIFYLSLIFLFIIIIFLFILFSFGCLMIFGTKNTEKNGNISYRTKWLNTLISFFVAAIVASIVGVSIFISTPILNSKIGIKV